RGAAGDGRAQARSARRSPELDMIAGADDVTIGREQEILQLARGVQLARRGIVTGVERPDADRAVAGGGGERFAVGGEAELGQLRRHRADLARLAASELDEAHPAAGAAEGEATA